MRLNQLLKHLTYEHVQGSQSREITDICYHSGNVREGSLFVCLKGLHNDGHDYLQGALEAGAAAVVVAAENVVPLDNDALLYTEQFGVRISEVIDRWQVSVVIAADTRHALAELAAAFLFLHRPDRYRQPYRRWGTSTGRSDRSDDRRVLRGSLRR